MIKIDNYLKKIYFDFKSSLLQKDCFVIGISCGIDSVLVLDLLCNSIPAKKIKAFFIDIESNEDKNYFEITSKYFADKGLKIEKIDLNDEYQQIIKKFNVTKTNGFGNIKSKLRSMFLYNVALENNGLVVNTLNYSEFFLGHFTKFGDSNGDLFPIIGIDKIDIFEIAKYLHLPVEIIQRKPTTGFNYEIDESLFGFSYNDLHLYLTDQEIKPTISYNIEKMRMKNAHKQRSLRPFINIKFDDYKD